MDEDYDTDSPEAELRRQRDAKLYVFKGLWLLTMLLPKRYTLLIKCGEARDVRYGQGPFVMIESAHFVLDKDVENTVSGQVIKAKAKPIQRGTPLPEFVYCLGERAVRERQAMLEGEAKEIEKGKYRVDEFCCDMVRNASDFFLYDHAGGRQPVLRYCGHYPPWGSQFRPFKHLVREFEDMGGFHALSGEKKAKELDYAHGLLRDGLSIGGHSVDDLPSCPVNCSYSRPVEHLPPDAELRHRGAQLRNCLKHAAQNLLRGEACDSSKSSRHK